jgi:hypothetical protein
MNTVLRLVFVLELIIALPATGYAVGAEAPNPAHRTMHQHQEDLVKATALATPHRRVVAPASRSPEIDGLSRHDEDCNMGCIDH